MCYCLTSLRQRHWLVLVRRQDWNVADCGTACSDATKCEQRAWSDYNDATFMHKGQVLTDDDREGDSSNQEQMA